MPLVERRGSITVLPYYPAFWLLLPWVLISRVHEVAVGWNLVGQVSLVRLCIYAKLDRKRSILCECLISETLQIAFRLPNFLLDFDSKKTFLQFCTSLQFWNELQFKATIATRVDILAETFFTITADRRKKNRETAGNS